MHSLKALCTYFKNAEFGCEPRRWEKWTVYCSPAFRELPVCLEYNGDRYPNPTSEIVLYKSIEGVFLCLEADITTQQINRVLTCLQFPIKIRWRGVADTALETPWGVRKVSLDVWPLAALLNPMDMRYSIDD